MERSEVRFCGHPHDRWCEMPRHRLANDREGVRCVLKSIGTPADNEVSIYTLDGGAPPRGDVRRDSIMRRSRGSRVNPMSEMIQTTPRNQYRSGVGSIRSKTVAAKRFSKKIAISASTIR